MSAGLPYLRSLRKSDLVVLADISHLQGYEDYKKTELESALDGHLSANKSSLSGEQRLSDYYRRLAAPPRSSPIKREPKADAGSGIEDLKRSTRSRRQPAQTKKEVEATDESEAESASSTGSSPAPATAATPARSRPSLLSLPPSPAVVTDAIDQQTTRVRKSVSEAWVASGFKERAYALRSCLSSVNAIQIIIRVLELYGLSREIVPWRHLTTIPPVDTARLPATQIQIPDLFVLLSSSFWAPFSLWLATSIILPSIFAYFFNISLKVAQSGAGPTHSYGTRRASAVQHAAATPKTNFDPLVFNVTKALVSILVYGNRFTFWNTYSALSVARVAGAVPGGLPGLLTGSAVCGLGSLYEAILRK